MDNGVDTWDWLKVMLIFFGVIGAFIAVAVFYGCATTQTMTERRCLWPDGVKHAECGEVSGECICVKKE